MKMNQAILNRLEKYRARKGFKSIDSHSKLYKAFKFIYFVSFLWYILLLLMIVLPVWIWPTEIGRNFDMLNKVVLTAISVGSIVAAILLMKRIHIVGASLNVAFLTAGMIQLKFLMHNNVQIDFDDSVYEIFGEEILGRYIWRHAAPAILAMICALVLLGIYIREKYLFKRDYNRVLDALYITYKDRLGSGTEEEWEALLSELDDEAIETEVDKQHTREYLEQKGTLNESSEESEE